MIDAVSSLASSVGPAGASTAATKTAAIAFAPPGGGAVNPATFGDVMSEIAAKGVQSLKSAEATSIMGMQGKASVQQVVEAVMNAEQSLQTAMAVRDKVVSAYQEISRMAI
ncbi:flagellar hook-basal body complex protein FliE [Salinarimonas soli]|uniref:Flagellar hook-basal body complex protein FliE n=1 Tax=Salinarimonas soli TaxID=1638099 RepID=A0A5B2V806_9HYPH|nr:flagellar hook-basal body complex protein FliE [Salinarimonas soli]KAA2234705.1 flagellar hook-basal body complex protein FliE [Salinarimonas soli]